MMKKRKRKPARRNPIAKALRVLRPKTEPDAKAYRRKPKHKHQGRPDAEDDDGPAKPPGAAFGGPITG